MMNSSVGDLDAAENYYGHPDASDSYENAEGSTLSALKAVLWIAISLTICCIGVVGNGCTIWLLGFQIKRNCFTTFILNLAIADFGHLISTVLIYIPGFVNFKGGEIFHNLSISFSNVMYVSTHLLMTAISIDRCVAILFPIWHHSSRPKHLSPAVCAFLWICSFLLVGMTLIMELTNVIEYYNLFNLHFLVSALICIPLITLSTGILFFKVCLGTKERNQGWLLLTILVTLFCFVILDLPQSVLVLIIRFCGPEIYNKLKYLGLFSILFSCLNSSIKPLIYFLVGRKKGAQSEKSLKVILQNAFKEGEET